MDSRPVAFPFVSTNRTTILYDATDVVALTEGNATNHENALYRIAALYRRLHSTRLLRGEIRDIGTPPINSRHCAIEIPAARSKLISRSGQLGNPVCCRLANGQTPRPRPEVAVRYPVMNAAS